MDSINNSQAVLVKIQSLRSSMSKAELLVCDYPATGRQKSFPSPT